MAESNRVLDLITPFIEQVQNVEDMLDTLRTRRILATCTDAQLDSFGEIIGITRQGLSDANYRIALYRQILLNMSSGQPEEIIRFVDSITSENFRLTEPYTATLRLDLNEWLTSWSVLVNGVNDLRPVGVSLEVVYTEDEDIPFNFGDEDGHVTDGFGFSEAGYPAGDATAGQLTERIINY